MTSMQAPSPGYIESAQFVSGNDEVALQLADKSLILDLRTMEYRSDEYGLGTGDEECFLSPCDSNQYQARADLDVGGQSRSSKIFVGGLNPCTSDEDLTGYFGQFGVVLSSKVIFSRDTGNSRRFGFAVFESAQVATRVCQMQNHEIRGYKIETRLAIPSSKLKKSAVSDISRESSRLSRQIFVGGLPTDVNPSSFREWAERTFPGRVVNAVLVVDRLTHTKSRGFGFVTFDSSDMVDFAAQARILPFADKCVEVKKAENMTILQKGGGKGFLQQQGAESPFNGFNPPQPGSSSKRSNRASSPRASGGNGRNDPTGLNRSIQENKNRNGQKNQTGGNKQKRSGGGNFGHQWNDYTLQGYTAGTHGTHLQMQAGGLPGQGFLSSHDMQGASLQVPVQFQADYRHGNHLEAASGNHPMFVGGRAGEQASFPNGNHAPPPTFNPLSELAQSVANMAIGCDDLHDHHALTSSWSSNAVDSSSAK
eukprot:CAMPEP_0181343756 /NCGR_PEP_ID=MMETSP1101-20121128/31769_1 /TAXON_ID=46948 /ORGANISM="Rhodomonas abbreviata, Strain Caron Lab Isolate" /LENGTH=479 /DNA_ID=CAMNT_0023455433 /DNA_START=87 /DNA_END=1526 /DNA_ORIENTATION=+